MNRRLPADFRLSSSGDVMRIEVTMATTQDLDAVVEALSIMRRQLPSHRLAVAADFGLPEPTPPTLIMQIMEVIG